MLARVARCQRNHDDREQNDAPNGDRVRADCRPERRIRSGRDYARSHVPRSKWRLRAVPNVGQWADSRPANVAVGPRMTTILFRQRRDRQKCMPGLPG